MTQTYTDPLALKRMDDGLCPECGEEVDTHSGWGSPACTLTDMGAADRIAHHRESKVPERPKPFYPVCPTSGHAHSEDSDCWTETRCCAYCPACEAPEKAVMTNRHLNMVHHSSSGHWEHQWCRGINSKGLPCGNRAYIYTIGQRNEQFYCEHHLKQDPTSRHFTGRVATKDS